MGPDPGAVLDRGVKLQLAPAGNSWPGFETLKLYRSDRDITILQNSIDDGLVFLWAEGACAIDDAASGAAEANGLAQKPDLQTSSKRLEVWQAVIHNFWAFAHGAFAAAGHITQKPAGYRQQPGPCQAFRQRHKTRAVQRQLTHRF